MASADWGQVRPSHLGEALVLNWSLHPGRGLPQNDEWITCLAVIAPMCSAALLAAAAGDSLTVMVGLDRQRRRDEAAIASAFGGAGARPALQLLSALVSQPVLSVSMAAETTGRAFANANRLVSRLVRLGILREITGRKRNRRYCYAPMVDLVSAPSDPE